MKLLYSTSNEFPNQSFRRWKEFITEAMGPAEHSSLNEAPFQASVEVGKISHINAVRLSTSGSKSIISSNDARYKPHLENVFVSIQLEGTSVCSQDGRISIRKPGEFTIMDNRPGAVEAKKNNKNLILTLPREGLEKMLGSTYRYTGITIGKDVTSASLATDFIINLVEISQHLNSDVARRMAAIGVDLIVASIAERLAQDVPRSLSNTVILQRSKSFIEDNLDDPRLDPKHLATAIGISLRRLQQIFQHQGGGISDWIWRRRLEVATKRIEDPGCAHRSIGELAYSCGFINQAHFTRRFKECHGLTPRDYRMRILLNLR